MVTMDRLKDVRDRVVDAFLLRSVEAEVAARPEATTDVVARLAQAAKLRVMAAEQLTGDSDVVAAITLYRDAAALLATARVAQHERATVPPASVDPASSWERLGSAGLDRDEAPDAIERVRPLLATNDVVAVDMLAPDEQRARRADAADAVAWLRAGVEPRSRAEVRAARYVRMATLVVVLLSFVIALIALVRAPKNLARGKPASASSRHIGTPAAEGATNGVIEATYGVHTDQEDSAWIAVDLLRAEKLREIRVYGRGDGYEADCVPLLLELSQDGESYVEIARRSLPIKQADPWVALPADRTARFVRLRTPARGYIALSEIQVYAGK